jgi:hypothetical protein
LKQASGDTLSALEPKLRARVAPPTRPSFGQAAEQSEQRLAVNGWVLTTSPVTLLMTLGGRQVRRHRWSVNFCTYFIAFSCAPPHSTCYTAFGRVGPAGFVIPLKELTFGLLRVGACPKAPALIRPLFRCRTLHGRELTLTHFQGVISVLGLSTTVRLCRRSSACKPTNCVE